MKHLLQHLPGLLAITGQSGAGKDTAEKVLLAWCKKLKIPVLSFGSGDLIRHYATLDTPLGREVRSLNERGERTPLPLVSEMVNEFISDNHAYYDHMILNGSPRYADQCDVLHKLMIESNYFYFKSIKVLEVIAPDEICKERLIKRVQEDKRTDLSIDGQPGVPDLAKIARKMKWWSDDCEAIRERAQELGIYASVTNDSNDPEHIKLKNGLMEIF